MYPIPIDTCQIRVLYGIRQTSFAGERTYNILECRFSRTYSFIFTYTMLILHSIFTVLHTMNVSDNIVCSTVKANMRQLEALEAEDKDPLPMLNEGRGDVAMQDAPAQINAPVDQLAEGLQNAQVEVCLV